MNTFGIILKDNEWVVVGPNNEIVAGSGCGWDWDKAIKELGDYCGDSP